MKLKFKTRNFDYSVFTHFCRIIMGIYVDNLLIIGVNINNINELKEKLIKLFDMIDFGLYHYYLKMKVICNKKNCILTFCQRSYLRNVLERFGIANSHLVTTSMIKYLMKSAIEYLFDLKLKKAN